MRVTKDFLPEELRPHWNKIRRELELIAKASIYSPDAPGVIEPDSVYTIAELAARLGVTKDTVLEWRAEGLKIHARVRGKVQLVNGREFIDWYMRGSSPRAMDVNA